MLNPRIEHYYYYVNAWQYCRLPWPESQSELPVKLTFGERGRRGGPALTGAVQKEQRAAAGVMRGEF